MLFRRCCKPVFWFITFDRMTSRYFISFHLNSIDSSCSIVKCSHDVYESTISTSLLFVEFYIVSGFEMKCDAGRSLDLTGRSIRNLPAILEILALGGDNAAIRPVLVRRSLLSTSIYGYSIKTKQKRMALSPPVSKCPSSSFIAGRNKVFCWV